MHKMYAVATLVGMLLCLLGVAVTIVVVGVVVDSSQQNESLGIGCVTKLTFACCSRAL